MGGVTTRHVWDGQNIVLDLNGDYSAKMSFVRGIRLVSYKNAAGERSVYNFNVHGDVLGITKDTSGAPARYQYDAFGNQIGDEASENPFRYFGQYTDAETGLIYLRARYYEPAIGQFISEDPAKSGLNWYSYCNGNPVMFVDPSGMYAKGDEELPDVIQEILNGSDRKSGGLTAEYKNARTKGEKERIAKFADMLRSYKGAQYDFDSNNIIEVVLLNNSNAVLGAGHNAIMLIDSSGRALYFSYNPDFTSPAAPGEMRFDVLPKSSVDLFFKTGKLNVVVASTGELANDEYNRAIRMTIKTEQGKKMFNEGISYLMDDGVYLLVGNQCDNVSAKIMKAGGQGYAVQWSPNASFERLAKNKNKGILKLGGRR